MLPLEHGDEVPNEDWQVFVTVPEGNEDGYLGKETGKWNKGAAYLYCR